MNKEQFFNYHANAGQKLIDLFISGKQETLNRKQFYKLANIKIELINGFIFYVSASDNVDRI
jgi:hypothetical protein